MSEKYHPCDGCGNVIPIGMENCGGCVESPEPPQPPTSELTPDAQTRETERKSA